MFSKILIKLIDESIVPALLLLATRLISVVGVARYNNIPFEVGAGGFVFKSQTDYVTVNSYSTFYMIVVVTVGLLFILSKSIFFHDTHIKPHIAARLFSFKLHPLIQSSYSLYTQGSIWLSYSYLLMIVSGLMSLFSLIHNWVFIVSLVLSVIATILFILDVEEELQIAKKHVPEVADTSYLREEEE